MPGTRGAGVCEAKDFPSEILTGTGVVHTLCKKSALLMFVKAPPPAGGVS